MSVHPPTKLAVALETLHRIVRPLGYDMTKVRPAEPAGDEHVEILNEMLRRFQTDGEATFFSHILTKAWYRKALSWPPRVLSLPPNHNERPIVFICGLPRSGTTFANELLGTDDRFRILRHDDLEIDMKQGKRALRLFFRDGYAPVDALHPLDSPPEDLQIMGQYVLADMIMGAYGAQHLLALPEARQHQLFELGYRFERDVYRRLPIAPTQTFVIKSPIIHMMYFEQFEHAFDDYRMVLLVRDVPTAALSFCNILEAVLGYIKRIEPSAIGPLVVRFLEGYVAGLERLTERDLEKFAFVDFRRFVADPTASLERIYRWLGMELSDALRDRYRTRQAELEKVHVSKQPKPEPAYFHLDMDAVRELERRYAAIYGARLW